MAENELTARLVLDTEDLEQVLAPIVERVEYQDHVLAVLLAWNGAMTERIVSLGGGTTWADGMPKLKTIEEWREETV